MHVLSTHAHNLENIMQVKVVNRFTHAAAALISVDAAYGVLLCALQSSSSEWNYVVNALNNKLCADHIDGGLSGSAGSNSLTWP